MENRKMASVHRFAIYEEKLCGIDAGREYESNSIRVLLSEIPNLRQMDWEDFEDSDDYFDNPHRYKERDYVIYDEYLGEIVWESKRR